MNNKVSLTIAILAYNHERTMRATLDSILCQLDGIKAFCDLEILISDNCSTDLTGDIAKKYKEQYPDIITYHRNQTNIGFGGNIKAVFENANKEYIWLFGDDILLVGAIKEFCILIEKCQKEKGWKPSVICTKAISSKDSLDKISQITHDKYLIYENIYELRSRNECSIFALCFISVTIIKKDQWQQFCHDLDFKNYYPHTDLAWKIARTKPIAMIDRPLVASLPAAFLKRENAEIIGYVPIAYLIVLKNIFGNFDLLNKEDIKSAKNHIFGTILDVRKTVKNPKQIIDALKQIDFLPKILLKSLRFFSYFGYKIAFKFLVFYVKADKILRKFDKDRLTLYNAIILTIILIILLIR